MKTNTHSSLAAAARTCARALALPAVLAAVAPAGAAAADVRPVGTQGPLKSERLSDERTITRLARPVEVGRIYARPSTQAPRRGRLHLETEDGFHEIYLVLRAEVDPKGRAWLQIRLPGRPNGRTGWVSRDMLGPLTVRRTFLKVDRRRLRATLYRDGRRIWRSPVGVGAPSTPTPAGRFWVRERLRALGGVYGPWAFGTAAYSRLSDWPGGGVIGIHGTDEPQRIPGRPSHGCVRLPNHKIVQLEQLMPVGTPVRIV